MEIERNNCLPFLNAIKKKILHRDHRIPKTDKIWTLLNYFSSNPEHVGLDLEEIVYDKKSQGHPRNLFKQEFNQIKNYFLNNGYQNSAIDKIIKHAD